MTATAKPGRVACCVPFCKRTGKDDGHVTEIICGPHWRPTDSRLRRSYKRLCKWLAPKLELDPSAFSEAEQRRIIARHRVAEAMWEKLKAEAIEAAMGIG